MREIRDKSVFYDTSTTLQDLVNLFKSVPAFVKFAEANGVEVWQKLLDNFIKNFLDILSLPSTTNLSDVKLDTRHTYFIIMGRNC